MKPLLACVLAFSVGAPTATALADPIHARANGDYWHHDSGWIFPERVVGFVRIGFPRDVAGSHDAVGYYERETNGARVIVDVDLFAMDSAAAGNVARRTVFMKSPGGTEFAFRNDHAGVTTNSYTADKWISPSPDPGDVVLFPSYLMHAVPMNPGERRITLAFNAIPTRLDSWGYRVSFAG